MQGVMSHAAYVAGGLWHLIFVTLFPAVQTHNGLQATWKPSDLYHLGRDGPAAVAGLPSTLTVQQ